MTKSLNGKVAIAAGPSASIIASVVQTLLKEGATVIVPANSALEIARLRASIADIDTGKLVTLLTNYPEYDKVFEIAESIIEQYGSMDIAIICFDATTTVAKCNIIEMDIYEWEKMIDNNITAFFVSARVVLASMKQYQKGMFVSIMSSGVIEDKCCTPVVGLTSYIQTEMAKMFFEEAKKFKIRCYHLSVNNAVENYSNNNLKGKNEPHHSIGDFVMQLYNSKSNSDESLFPNWRITAQINNTESI